MKKEAAVPLSCFDEKIEEILDSVHTAYTKSDIIDILTDLSKKAK